MPTNFPTLDAHMDCLAMRLRFGRELDLAAPAECMHADLERMRKGNLAAACLYVGDLDLAVSARFAGAVYRMAENHPDDFALCRSARQVRSAVDAAKVALIMTIEGMDMFAESIEALEAWLRLGVRIASLTHGEGKTGGQQAALQTTHSYFGYLPPAERDALRRQAKGLTSFGLEALELLGRRGIPCDLAHTNDAAFWQAIENAAGPLCYTHGNCYALCRHSRNLTDDMMRALARKGGVMGLTSYEFFVDPDNCTIQRTADHFIHALEVMGPEHVGFGGDFDGIAPDQRMAVEDVSQIQRLWEELAARGIDEATIRAIAIENFLRILPDDDPCPADARPPKEPAS